MSHKSIANLHTDLDLERQQLVGLTSTYFDAPEGTRFDLALETIDGYRETKLPLVVVDASPSKEVADIFSNRGAIVVPAPRPGLATQYIDGAKFALERGANRLLKQEPEKTGMSKFSQVINDALDDFDVLVIGRTDEGLRSLPPTQARTEKMAGWLLEQHLGFPPDALSGGRAFTARGAEHLVNYDVEQYGNNWMYLYTSVLDARQAGHAVGGILVDLIHPPKMTAEETNNAIFDTKRYQQFFLQMDMLLGKGGYEPLTSINK